MVIPKLKPHLGCLETNKENWKKLETTWVSTGNYKYGPEFGKSLLKIDDAKGEAKGSPGGGNSNHNMQLEAIEAVREEDSSSSDDDSESRTTKKDPLSIMTSQ